MKLSECHFVAQVYVFISLARLILSARPPIVCKLFTLIHKAHPNENVVISPDTLRMALGALYYGANGQTKQELATVFHYGNSKVAEPVLNELSMRYHREENFWHTVNRLYVIDDFHISSEYKVLIQDKFHVSARNHEFLCIVPDINAWFSSQTSRIFERVVDRTPIINRKTKAVFVSVAYFKGDWEKPFDVAQSVKGSSNQLLMKQTDNFLYGHVSEIGADVVQLGFKNTSIKMMFFVPKTAQDLPSLEGKLNKFEIDNIAKRLSTKRVNLKIPKFQINFGANLEKQFHEIGLSKAFSGEGGEFNGIIESDSPLLISTFIHRASIDVDERGIGTDIPIPKKKLQVRTPGAVNVNAEKGFYFSIYDDKIYYATGLFKGLK